MITIAVSSQSDSQGTFLGDVKLFASLVGEHLGIYDLSFRQPERWLEQSGSFFLDEDDYLRT